MPFDLRTHLIRYNAEYDRVLCFCRRYYRSLIPAHQDSLKKYLAVMIERNPMRHALAVEVSIQTEHQTVSVHPAVLLRAIRKWDKRKTYTRLAVPVSKEGD